MRIIAGRYRSRKLKTVPSFLVRPTPDRLREAMFSILMPRIEGSVFFDIYAGSGAIGIEALSRGATHVVLIEKSAQAVAIIRDNLQALGAEAETTVVRGSAAAVLPQLLPAHKPDLVFLDPPYDRTAEYAQTLTILGEAGSPYAIAQHPSRLDLEEEYGHLRRFRILKQGDNSLSFYQTDDSSSE